MIFRIKQVYVCFSWYFFVMLSWVIFTRRLEEFFMCLLALVIHEVGHIAMIYILGEKINIFYVLPFGFCCRLKNQNKIENSKMIKILLAGPVTSLCVAGLFFWTKGFSLPNFIIGIFNLLPIGDLDGGRVNKIIDNR